MPAPVNTFEELNLPPAMMANITRCKYTQPTPVQRYAIPIGISGRDLMACAQVRRVWVEAGSGSAPFGTAFATALWCVRRVDASRGGKCVGL